MKMKMLVVAALVLASSVFAVAADVPRMAVVAVKGSEVFKVIYKSETAGKVKLRIYNAESRVILTETFNGVDGFILPINFRGLDSGEYTIELIDASGSRIEKINFTKSSAAKEAEARIQRFAHVSRVPDGRFLLSVVNGQEKVNVQIYSAEDVLVYSETIATTGDFAKIYRVDKPAGVTFRVSDSNGVIKTIQF